MIHSRQELSVALAAVALCAVVAGARAQTGDGAPAPLQSLAPRPAPVVPRAADKPARDQAASVPMVPPGGEPPPPAVVVSTLGGVDGPAVGLLDDANGGLGSQMWSGSDRSALEDELTRIPVATTDPVVRALARRLLLTASEAPTGPSRHALITIRIERLMDAGLIDEAGALAAQASLPNDPEFARVQAEALLYADRTADICSDRTAARLASADPFWLQLRAYCYDASGDGAAAELTRAIMAAKSNDDAMFDVLLDEAFGGREKKPPPGEARPTAIDIFLLRKAGFPITNGDAAPLGTAANLLAVRDARNPPGDRLAAAERILSTGALSTDDLKAVADAQTFTPAQKADVSGTAEKLSFLAREALFRQIAALESRTGARLELIKKADPTLSGHGPFHVFASLETANVASLVPDPALGEPSWIAARTAMLGGAPEIASGWIGPPSDHATARAGLALDIISPTADRNALAATDIEWLSQHAVLDGGWPASSALALALWQALGHSLPPDAQPVEAALAGQTFDGNALGADKARALDAAASQQGKRGEAVLLVLDAIGTNGPAHFTPSAVVHFVAVLRNVGLDDSARALAAEALLLGPPPTIKMPAGPPLQAAQ